MSTITQIKEAVGYYLRADTIYNVHSPIVYDFANGLFDDNRQYYIFEKIERLRKKLLSDETKIEMVDFGAGSKSGAADTKAVKAIANTALTKPFFCELLFKIVNHYQPETILEFGTSLGIASCYLSSARRASSQLITLEGNPSVAKIASKNFKQLELQNVTQVTGAFEQTLPPLLEKLTTLDLVFFDGNHQKAPTLDYFERCLSKAHENSIFIFDDIYWSTEMTAAWKILKQHDAVSHSIDLYQFGILFFKKKQQVTEHFTLVPHKWKPWSAGFFG